nr:glycosyltransferase [Fimbriiglobus sp.]
MPVMLTTNRDREEAEPVVRSLAFAARPVRVSFMIDDLSRAGTESQLLALIRGIDRSAVTPSLVLLNGEGELSRSLEPTDCPVLRLGVRRLASVKALSAVKRLRRFWRDHRPEVAQIYFHDSAYFGVPVAKLCGVKKVVRVRNNLGYQQTRKHRILSRLIRPLLSGVLTNSELGRDAITKTDKMPPNRVTVIENGVDLERYGVAAAEGVLWDSDGGTDSRREAAILRVGVVANLRPIKNIDGLLRAAVQVLARFPQARFEVAGDGEQRAELEKLHAELKLGDRFVLRGSVTDIPAFLRSLDVAVLPSHSEGMSNAVMEYMAAGRPVVATAVGANPKLLWDAGVLLRPGDVAALAEAIGGLLADPFTRG